MVMASHLPFLVFGSDSVGIKSRNSVLLSTSRRLIGARYEREAVTVRRGSHQNGLHVGTQFATPEVLALAVTPESNVRNPRFLEIELQVRDYELDQYGVVNNSVYSNYCEHGHTKYMEMMGVRSDDVVRDGEALALADVHLKFISPLQSGDRFVIRVRMSGTSTVRMFFEQFIYKLQNKELVLKAKATGVWLNKTGRPIRVPSLVKTKVAQFDRWEI